MIKGFSKRVSSIEESDSDGYYIIDSLFKK
jgi:hypothetical protein